MSSFPVRAMSRDSVERTDFTLTKVYPLVEAGEGEWKTLIMAAHFIGLSLSDFCRLGWSDIDHPSQTLSTKVNRTKKSLFFPIHPELQALLTKLSASYPGGYFVMPSISMQCPGAKHGMSEGMGTPFS